VSAAARTTPPPCVRVCLAWLELIQRANTTIDLLGTTPFNGRPIFIDGRNAKEEILIKKLVSAVDMLPMTPRSPHTPRTAPQLMQIPMSTPPLVSPATSDYGQVCFLCLVTMVDNASFSNSVQWSPTATVSLVPTPTTTYGMQPVPLVMVRDYQDPNSWYPPYDPGFPDASTALPAPAPAPAYHYPQVCEFYENPYPTSSVYTTSQELDNTTSRRSCDAPGGVVETEYRKIIVKGLSKWAQSEQIKVLLRSRCGFSGGEVNSIKIPQSKDGGNRGHATITFMRKEHAARAIEKLNKHKFDGTALDVDYTREGVSRNEEKRQKYHQHQPSSRQHQREDKEKKDAPKSSGSMQEKKEKPIKKGVIIANGSSCRTTSHGKRSQ
jgi:hypothetical protein